MRCGIRGVTATALVAGLALAATACGGGDGGSGGSSGSELSGTVTFWDTSNDAEKATYRKLAEGFQKEHPKVHVQYVNVPFGEANAKFKNAAGGNSGAPDVMRTEVAWTADFANLGYLAPLDGTPALDKTDDYLPQAVGSTKFKGKTYAAPQVIDTLGLFYNKKILKDAGVGVPKTFAELTTAAKKIKAKTGATALYLRGDDPYWFLPYLYGEGGNMVDARDKIVQIDDGAGVKAFKTIKDLVDSKAAVTDATDGQENQLKALKDGTVAMAVDGPWDIEGARAGKAFKDKENLGVAPVPAGSKAQGSPQGGWNLSVYAGSKNLQASYAFVKYMSSAKVQQQTTDKLSLLPTRKSVYDVPAVKNNEMVKFFKPAVDGAVQRPWIAEGNSLFEPIKVQMNKVLTGSATPEQAAKATGDAYRKLLKDYK
ncbi:carbohydrate ABC transporter substrate-binding protein (CUT1 family) [Streptomyces sp. 2333.5]|uniref:extracellular solute-binding protein n=1 Tax=unclassified Streptomyces TaxID=2593676 RepID=UPI000896D4F6|nr:MULTISPECIES: extracellular solute-binding protein [unclassified Streptomyces]PJJ01575.1 carbohydrate ABC transporter substrate-binding protein (CUT1 family) [Streptomyces sp. 2333.5]SEC69483.1 carbohydrate ABC transporter substrate-binding protein, CUT1 family [Streptomyces sp. 2314.4]SED48185.1 carbohydrate ABC transporter substrate-binding protein, CUT1 family [Streptomyces sp. 2112.2]SOE14140.1 carbohydrate ABC transporter substrate-binding protein, CUT1 family [Streptomyces sp. 2323.1]